MKREIPNYAYYISPINVNLLDKGKKVPVIMVQKDTEGYFNYDYKVSSWAELSELNEENDCTILDAFVLFNLSMCPNVNTEKLYEMAFKRFYVDKIEKAV